VPGARYLVYWSPPEQQIGDAVDAGPEGQIPPFTYTVPISVTVGSYEVIARLEGQQVSARAPFEVTE